MSRPFTDISAINPSAPINNIGAVCSTTFTGKSSKLLAVANYPANLTINNIDNKFGNRFYNGIFVNVLTGDLNGGTSLQ